MTLSALAFLSLVTGAKFLSTGWFLRRKDAMERLQELDRRSEAGELLSLDERGDLEYWWMRYYQLKVSPYLIAVGVIAGTLLIVLVTVLYA